MRHDEAQSFPGAYGTRNAMVDAGISHGNRFFQRTSDRDKYSCEYSCTE